MKPLLFACSVALVAAPVDVGTLDQKPPAKAELKVPKSKEGVPEVELRTDVSGKAKAGEKRTVYVLVCPISVPELVGTWWVQAETTRDGDKFTADAQFGDGDNGAGDFFAVIGVATDKAWAVGEQVTDLPKDAAYSKLKLVRRQP